MLYTDEVWKKAMDNASAWGSKGNAAKKDPQKKRVPKTMTKKRNSSDPKPYQKKMS